MVIEFNLKSVCNPNAQKKAQRDCERIWVDMRKEKFSETLSEKEQLIRDRKNAGKYFVSHYEREQRYLIIFARDFSDYLNSSEWLQSDSAKLQQKYFDFLLDFESLKAKMREFCWSKEFLLENGIDFAAIRKLYFSVR